MQYILYPFSWFLTVCHDFFNSYGIALILFTIVIKAILFPFNLKAKRSMIAQTLVQDKVQKIQKQYANDRAKMNEEMQALYAKENIKPMSGCIWSLIPLVILWPLYAIIRRPLTYMMHLTSDAIVAVANALNAGTLLGIDISTSTVSSAYNEMKLAGLLNSDTLSTARQAAESVVSGAGDKLFQINFHFLGLDLSSIPQWKFWTSGTPTWGYIGLFLLPLVSAALGITMTIISQKTNRVNKNQPVNRQQNSSMRMMMVISPLISLYIGYAYPAALCIYWISNNVLSIVQELICGKILRKDYLAAEERRLEQERLEKEAEKKRKQEAAERKYRAMEQAKANKGKKKKKKPQPKKQSQAQKELEQVNNNEASRVGMRRYARGRSYDPDRYGGVTPYLDPAQYIDEDAIEKARQEREEQDRIAQTKEAMRKFDLGLELEPEEQELVDAELLKQAEETLEEEEGTSPSGEEEIPALDSSETQEEDSASEEAQEEAPEPEEETGEEKGEED